MKTAKITLITILLLALTIVTVKAFTIDAPNFYFIASHGGNVTFARSFTMSRWVISDGLTGLYQITWLGIPVGYMGFDAATGVNINVTHIQANRVTYTPTYAVGGVSYIQKPGAGEPTEVLGGTYAFDAVNEITTVTADGSGTPITIRWDPAANSLYTNLVGYITLAALIPFVVALMYLVNLVQGGEFDPKVAAIIAGLAVTFVIIAALMSQFV